VQFKDRLKFDAQGLIPAVVQDAVSGEVLMVAYMNRASLEKTLETAETWFWSRSRQKFWHKGESSGHVQRVREVFCDCDADTLLIKVEQTGAACHEGYPGCFHYRESGGGVETVGAPVFDPATVYGQGAGKD